MELSPINRKHKHTTVFKGPAKNRRSKKQKQKKVRISKARTQNMSSHKRGLWWELETATSHGRELDWAGVIHTGSGDTTGSGMGMNYRPYTPTPCKSHCSTRHGYSDGIPAAHGSSSHSRPSVPHHCWWGQRSNHSPTSVVPWPGCETRHWCRCPHWCSLRSQSSLLGPATISTAVIHWQWWQWQHLWWQEGAWPRGRGKGLWSMWLQIWIPSWAVTSPHPPFGLLLKGLVIL